MDSGPEVRNWNKIYKVVKDYLYGIGTPIYYYRVLVSTLKGYFALADIPLVSPEDVDLESNNKLQLLF